MTSPSLPSMTESNAPTSSTPPFKVGGIVKEFDNDIKALQDNEQEDVELYGLYGDGSDDDDSEDDGNGDDDDGGDAVDEDLYYEGWKIFLQKLQGENNTQGDIVDEEDRSISTETDSTIDTHIAEEGENVQRRMGLKSIGPNNFKYTAGLESSTDVLLDVNGNSHMAS